MAENETLPPGEGTPKSESEQQVDGGQTLRLDVVESFKKSGKRSQQFLLGRFRSESDWQEYSDFLNGLYEGKPRFSADDIEDDLNKKCQKRSQLLQRNPELKTVTAERDLRSQPHGQRLYNLEREITVLEEFLRRKRALESPIQGAGQTRHRTTGGRKSGPKLDYETASRVAEIVERVAPNRDWRSKLNDICEALDEASIPCPKTWRRRQPTILDCSDAGVTERGLAVKAISHHLRNAAKRSR